MPVPMLQRVVTSDHFNELMAEETLEPRGEQRKDLRAAIIAATAASMFSKKSPPLSKFMAGDLLRPRRKQTTQEMHNIFKTFVGIHNQTNGNNSDTSS